MKDCVIIAGGGTGGHIYPGIAMARALQEKSDLEVHFVGTSKGLENKILPREGFPLHLISIGQLNTTNVLKKMMTLFLMPLAFLQSVWICLRLRPKAVLGVGGYASGPFVLMASIMGFKTALWEPNAHPGLANRILSRFVRVSFVVFERAAKILKSKNSQQIGMPVRFEISESTGSQGKFNILVFGGSLGAHTLNKVLMELLEREEDLEFNLVHQTGSRDFQDMKARYEKLPQRVKDKVEVHEFLHDMKDRYRWADFVICRAGASTVAELAACGKPAIFVPFPYAADNHQQKNAEELVKVGAARMILNKDLNPKSLSKEIQELKSNPSRLKEMAEKTRSFHKPKAAEKVVEGLLSL